MVICDNLTVIQQGKNLRSAQCQQQVIGAFQRLNRLFPILERFKLEPKVYRSQNLYFEMSLDNKERKPGALPQEWLDQFLILFSRIVAQPR